MNADDFGLTSGVNRAIAELHRAGLVTSATMMARAEATEEAIELARATPLLGVGCHVVLVDGDPVLAPQAISSLASTRPGRFQPTLGNFLRRLFAGCIRSSELEAEAAAQIEFLLERGVALKHIDTHKHVHMFPAVLRPLLRAAKASGIRTVRNPFEPQWSLRATAGAPWLRRTQVSLLRRLEPAFKQIVAEEGFTTTDGAIGVLATGSLDAATLASLLSALPEGRFELVTHPGYNDADLARAHTRLLSSRENERVALLTLKHFSAIELASFACLLIEN